MPDDARRYHHGDLRNALVRAGIELLEAQGLADLSLRAIAARAGVSHAAPRNHFGSLKGLLTAIAAEGFRRHAALMRDGVDDASGASARAAAAMEGYVRFATGHPHLFALMFSQSHCDFSDAELGSAAGASYAVLADVAGGLDWAGAEGGQRRAEMMLWSMVHGYATLRLNGQFDGTAGATPVYGIAEVMPSLAFRD